MAKRLKSAKTNYTKKIFDKDYEKAKSYKKNL